MEYSEDITATALFFDRAISEIARIKNKSQACVLDFGCGTGQLAQCLVELGYDAHGCDTILMPDAPCIKAAPHRFKRIDQAPYRLPFDDDCFDVVLSTSVLEHARNPHEYLVEIRRVLKPGGCAMHLLPSKWYLPCEPHILVPFANYFYPHCPTWWLAFWVLLGQRNLHYKGRNWRETVKAYREFYDTGLYYLSTRQHERLSRTVFGNCEWPMEFYITHTHGGFARLCRKLPMRKLWGTLSREFRMAFMVQRKLAA